MAKMCEEIFTAVYSEEMMIEDERVVALLTDAFKVWRELREGEGRTGGGGGRRRMREGPLQVISCEQMQLKLDVGKKGDEDEDEPAPKELQVREGEG